MKTPKIVALVVCIFLLANCGKEDAPIEEIEKSQEQPKTEKPQEPKPVTYLKFNSNLDQATENTDDYVVVHDQNGKFLGHQSFEKGDNLVFQTMDSSLVEATTLTITVLRILNFEHITTHEIRSHTEIEIGAELFPIKRNAFSSATDTPIITSNGINPKTKNHEAKNDGTFDLKVTKTNGVARYAISTEIYRPAYIDYMPQEIDSLVLNDLTLRKNSKYLISLEDFDGNYRYHFFDVPETDGKLEFDFSNFQEFDNILEVAMPIHNSSSGNSIGYSSADNVNITGFDMSFHAEQGEAEKVRFGYIDSLEFYFSHLFVDVNPSFEFFHTAKGNTLPEKMEILDQPSFTITNNELYNFKFDTDASYLRSEVVWRYFNNNANDLSISTSWRVFAAPGNQPFIGDLPEELIELHPEINLENLSYDRTELITLDDNYENFIKKSFGLEPAAKSWVLQKISLK